MILNRLDIINDIDSNTPKIVIQEICESHLIKINEKYLNDKISTYLNRVIHKIYNYPKITIYGEYKRDLNSLKKIATYVNGKCQWKIKSLLKAFNFLQSFKNVDNFDKIIFKIIENIEDFSYGNRQLRIQNL